MSLHTDERYTELIDKRLSENEIMMFEVRQENPRFSRIEVWAEDGETCYGTLPMGSTVEHALSIMAAHNIGMFAGAQVGRAEVKSAFRSLLGL